MKPNKEIAKKNKFNLEKFEVAKLKNLHVIVGGGVDGDDPIDTNKNSRVRSSNDCNQ